MTERAKDKLKPRLSLSKKRKKKGDLEPETSASNTPITSFFSSQPPPKLACPLCGQLVPRFRINEHIDWQCQNFERGGSPAGSTDVVSNTHMSPGSKPPKSPELGNKEEKEGTKTSPYFKNTCQQTPGEMTSKTVVRTIELGSLSSKLSRKKHSTPEKQPTEDNTAPSETLSSSQKENVLIQTSEDKKDLNVSSVDSPAVLCSETEAVKSTSPSKTTKRKKETTSGDRTFGSQKKSKQEEKSGEPNQAQRESEVLSSSCGPALSSEETFQRTLAGAVENQGPDAASLPYYLRNFLTVLHAVLENEDDGALFNQDDMSAVRAFKNLSGVFTQSKKFKNNHNKKSQK